MTRGTTGGVLEAFVLDVHALLRTTEDENVVTHAVAALLREALADGITLPEGTATANPDHYVMYPLYVDPEGAFSIASAVWAVGQGTPVHGHETWGVVGIHSGVEREEQYEKPAAPDVPLASKGEAREWEAGAVTICCTTDDDVHQVSCAGDVPVVGIHVYGADIGTLWRRSYDPSTGAVSWFVSNWTLPATQTR